MKFPNVFLNDLQAKERDNHPDMTTLIRYETPEHTASIKYFDGSGATLTVEMERFGVAEIFWYKDSQCEGKGKGIVLQEIEFSTNGNENHMDILNNPDLIDGTILGKIDKKWFEICSDYAYNRDKLGIDYMTCQQVEYAAKSFGINLNGFAYQGFSITDCLNIAAEAQRKGVPYKTLLEQKIEDAEVKGIDAVKKETTDYLDSKQKERLERD